MDDAAKPSMSSDVVGISLVNVDDSERVPLMQHVGGNEAQQQQQNDLFNLKTQRERRLLLFLLVLDAMLAVIVIAHPDLNPFAKSMQEKEEDVNLAWSQLFLGITSFLVAIAAVAIVFPRFKESTTLRFQLVAALKVLSIFFDLASLTYPTTLRLAVIWTVVALRISEVLVVVLMLYKHRVHARKFRSEKLEDTVLSKLNESDKQGVSLESALNCIKNIDTWIHLKYSRRIFRRKMRIGRHAFLIACSITFVLSYAKFFFEFKKVLSTQPAFFSSQELGDMNQREVEWNRTMTPNKVVLVIVDGLRYDFLERNREMKSFLANQTIRNDLKVLHMEAQLPSMSVPNWISLVTGAPPEMTGVLGNLIVPETQYDSIFREAQKFNVMRGLTASPWFGQIFKSTLPFLQGDGTISTSTGADGTKSSNVADQLRFQVAKTALLQKENPYIFFLVHFSDVDIQGHCCGVSTKWNKHNTYNGAVTNKTILIHELVDLADEETIIFIVSDHGHVERGGHGGVLQVLRQVPLIIYKKGSNFGNKTVNHTTFSSNRYSNLDVAPTITSLLNLPVPRQNLGKLIPEAMLFAEQPLLHYQNLFYQKQQFVKDFLRKVKKNKDDPLLQNGYFPVGSNPSIEEYSQAVEKIMDLYHSNREADLHIDIVRNVAISAVIIIFLGAIAIFVLQTYTFVDMLSIFEPRQHKQREDWKANATALSVAFIATATFYIISISSYLICYQVYGYSYEIWDSTVIHTPEVVPQYFLFCILPSCLSAYIVIRAYQLRYSQRPPQMPTSTLMQKLRAFRNQAGWILGTHGAWKEIHMIYLIRHYMVLLTVFFCLTFFVAKAFYDFLLPGVFEIAYITEPNWKYRFQFLTVQLISAPLIVANCISIYAWPAVSLRSSTFDSIYLLKIKKDKRNVAQLKHEILLQRNNILDQFGEVSSIAQLVGIKNVED